MLHLLPKQGYQIYKYFVSLDQKGDGEVTVEEFHKFFKLTETPFSNRVFMAVDLDGSGELDFQEFLLGIWNLCTFDDKSLIKFCFDIFDVDKGGTLDMAELDALCRMLTGLDEITGDLKKTLDNIDADGDGEVSLDEMVSYNVAYPELLQPAFDLRNKLQKGIYGTSFWKELRAVRLKHYGSCVTVESILLSERMKRRAEKAELERVAAEEQAKLDAEVAEQKGAEERTRKAREHDEMVRMQAEETETETELREALVDLERAMGALKNFKDQASAGTLKKDEKEGEEENEDEEEIEKHLKTMLVSALSRALAANVMNQENSLKIAEAEVKVSTKEFVDAYFETPVGKKYAVDLLDNEIILFQRQGGYVNKKEKARLKDVAYQKYFQKKYDEIVKATRLKYDRFNDDMILINYKLKKDAVDLIGLLKAAHAQWGWMELTDSASGANYYFCQSTGTSLWDPPINNVMDQCHCCGRKLTTIMRCPACGNKEYCRECDPTVHFGQLQHHERLWICEEELDWRRRKRWFNNQIRKDKKTFYYMDLMYLPDELDLQDNDKEDKARVRKQEGDKFGIVNETDDEESGEEKSNAESGAETASDSSDEGNNNA